LSHCFVRSGSGQIFAYAARGACSYLMCGEQGLEQGFVTFDRRRNDDQRGVCETGANRFCLTSFVAETPA
jgi:hypothetical protein